MLFKIKREKRLIENRKKNIKRVRAKNRNLFYKTVYFAYKLQIKKVKNKQDTDFTGILLVLKNISSYITYRQGFRIQKAWI